MVDPCMPTLLVINCALCLLECAVEINMERMDFLVNNLRKDIAHLITEVKTEKSVFSFSQV